MFSEALEGLSMTVTVKGDQFDVAFKPGDLIRFERHTGRPIADLANTNGDGAVNFKMEDLAFLAFAALTRTDRYDGDFDAFIDDLDDIDLTNAEEAADPTPAAG